MDIKGTCIASTIDEHGPVYVYQTKKNLILSFDGKIYQSCIKLNNINGLSLAYTQAMMAALFFIPNLKTAMIMGLGAGSIAKSLYHAFPALTIHTVEYRKAVADMAIKYFEVPVSERLFIHIDDAANYMKKTQIKTDVIFSDLYSSEGMESDQVQSSYLRDCKNALTLDGVLVLNICHTKIGQREVFDQLLEKEFAGKILSFIIEGGNKIVFAFNNKMPALSEDELLAKAHALQKLINVPMTRYAGLLFN